MIVALSNLPLTAQSEPTLRELANQQGVSGAIIDACGPPPSLSDIVEQSDLIVEGIVTARTSYLTPDDRDVFTDYDLTIQHVLLQRKVLASSRPGIAIPVIFKSHGGMVVIDGVKISVDINVNGARMTLGEGDHAYLLATLDAADGKWLINAFHVFKIKGTDVITAGPFRDLPREIPVPTFVQRIGELQATAAIRPSSPRPSARSAAPQRTS